MKLYSPVYFLPSSFPRNQLTSNGCTRHIDDGGKGVQYGRMVTVEEALREALREALGL